LSRQQFGGNWTEEKLQSLRKYLGAYMTVMKKQPFQTFYIDAFAGTGYRKPRSAKEEVLIKQLVDEDSEEFRKGSATIALEISPSFDKYIFVESDPKNFAELAKLKNVHSRLADRITLHKKDAAVVIKELCSLDWIKLKWRGVIFLDPFGMNVSWQTIEAIAKTHALDLWLLFPLGVGVNRMITKDGKIQEAWREKLNILFGTNEWQQEFYKPKEPGQLKLFNNNPVRQLEKAITLEGIALYFNERLKTIFPGVADNPLMLTNSKNNPIYLLCFAVGNPAGKGPALRIAQHILRRK